MIFEQKLQVMGAGGKIAEIDIVFARGRPATGARTEQIGPVEPGKDAVIDAETGLDIGRPQGIELLDDRDFGARRPGIGDRRLGGPVGIQAARIGQPVAERPAGGAEIGGGGERHG
jgi:hypothetical protein